MTSRSRSRTGPGPTRATSWPRRSPSSTGRARWPPTARRITTPPVRGRRSSGCPRSAGRECTTGSTRRDDFVLDPLRSIPGNASLKRAARRLRGRAAELCNLAGRDAYTAALEHARFPDGLPVLPPGHYGPVAPMMSSLAGLAQSGGLDGALLTSSQFYQTNYTKPLLFLSGGSFFESRAEAQHLLGDPMGNDERDGKLSGPGMAVALHLLVPDRALQHLGERRRADLRPDGVAESRLHLRPLHPRPSKPAAVPRGPPADLARPLPAASREESRLRGGSNDLHDRGGAPDRRADRHRLDQRRRSTSSSSVRGSTSSSSTGPTIPRPT